MESQLMYHTRHIKDEHGRMITECVVIKGELPEGSPKFIANSQIEYEVQSEMTAKKIANVLTNWGSHFEVNETDNGYAFTIPIEVPLMDVDTLDDAFRVMDDKIEYAVDKQMQKIQAEAKKVDLIVPDMPRAEALSQFNGKSRGMLGGSL